MQNIKLIEEIKDSAKNNLFIIEANEKVIPHDTVKLVFDALSTKVDRFKPDTNKLVISSTNNQKDRGTATMIWLAIQALKENKDISTMAFILEKQKCISVFQCFSDMCLHDEDYFMAIIRKGYNEHSFDILFDDRTVTIYLINKDISFDMLGGVSLDCLFIDSPENLFMDKMLVPYTALYGKNKSFQKVIVFNADNTWVKENIKFNKYLSK